ncbi:WD-40 repeat-containing protein MSI4-like [Cynara cardunculus var. scolymus]|uniref:WD-40 repeat-containing protein MSI4-like n=1 Tax=Cynara cardunculus var. scolymus TaxID=59895 RepID=UPI000D62E358|nr:WD-40 repeat-containing protein MSI4-like [Cynara cardunculus var. scolymus]
MSSSIPSEYSADESGYITIRPGRNPSIDKVEDLYEHEETANSETPALSPASTLQGPRVRVTARKSVALPSLQHARLQGLSSGSFRFIPPPPDSSSIHCRNPILIRSFCGFDKFRPVSPNYSTVRNRFPIVTGKDKSVVLWSIHDHISTLATEPGLTKSPGASGGKNLKTGGDDDKRTESPVIQARGVFQGHDDTVEDVHFSPSSAQEFCSVGDDSCLILWDARIGSSPAVKVEKAHNADLHCVDWNSLDENLILTGSADNTVRLFDRRNLTANGVGSPIHIFENHSAAVLCVQVYHFCGC